MPAISSPCMWKLINLFQINRHFHNFTLSSSNSSHYIHSTNSCRNDGVLVLVLVRAVWRPILWMPTLFFPAHMIQWQWKHTLLRLNSNLCLNTHAFIISIHFLWLMTDWLTDWWTTAMQTIRNFATLWSTYTDTLTSPAHIHFNDINLKQIKFQHSREIFRKRHANLT